MQASKGLVVSSGELDRRLRVMVWALFAAGVVALLAFGMSEAMAATAGAPLSAGQASAMTKIKNFFLWVFLAICVVGIGAGAVKMFKDPTAGLTMIAVGVFGSATILTSSDIVSGFSI